MGQAVQARAGWISPGAMNYVCMRLDVAPADAYGVATFYSLLSTEPQPPRVVHVCEDIACRCNGALDVIAQLEERFGAAGELSDDGSATWLRSPCLGQCDRGPAAMVTVAGERPEEHVIVHGTAEQVRKMFYDDLVYDDTAIRQLIDTFGVTGFDGGQLRKMAKQSFHAACHDMGVVESLHLIGFHYVVGCVYALVNGKKNVQQLRAA